MSEKDLQKVQYGLLLLKSQDKVSAKFVKYISWLVIAALIVYAVIEAI